MPWFVLNVRLSPIVCLFQVPRIGRFIKESFYEPSGKISDYVARKLIQKFISPYELSLIAAISIAPNSKIFFIGIGNGDGLKKLLQRKDTGVVFTMDRVSCRMNRAERKIARLSEGRLVILDQLIGPICLPDHWIDMIIHPMYYPFWCNDSRSAMKELRRVLKPSGRWVAGMNISNNIKSLYSVFPYVDVYEYLKLLDDLGFDGIHVEYGVNGIDIVTAHAPNENTYQSLSVVDERKLIK
ncbi:hypothetical protein ACOME3_003365 [Neoechinorhynchus agilis]